MSEWKATIHENPKFICPSCKSNQIIYRIVESFDGGHEDINYLCKSCRKDWWVEGSDY